MSRCWYALAGFAAGALARFVTQASHQQVEIRPWGHGGGSFATHELAHAFHDGVPFLFPRSGLMEPFANMALYAFVVASEPELATGVEEQRNGIQR